MRRCKPARRACFVFGANQIDVACLALRASMRWLCLLLAGCIVAKRSLTMPPNDVTTVALLTGALPHPMSGIARHPWFAVRHAGEQRWEIYEVGGGGRELDPFSHHDQYLDPILVKVWRGDDAERAAACLDEYATDVKDR